MAPVLLIIGIILIVSVFAALSLLFYEGSYMNFIALLVGVFFIAHGLVHILYRVPAPNEKWPFNLGHSWLLTRLGLGERVLRKLGTVLWIAAMAGFVLGGLGVFGVPLLKEVWRPEVAVSSVMSFLLIGLFWHRNFVFALLLNAGIFVALVWLHWPSVEMIGW